MNEMIYRFKTLSFCSLNKNLLLLLLLVC